VTSPFFIFLTVLGNSAILVSSVFFYFIEAEHNPQVSHMFDAIWWAFATATTTGYGDITPVTIAGKTLSILLMLLGLALFAMYTGLFAELMIASRKQHDELYRSIMKEGK
jgi:voltage-gated potassium channel